MVTKMWLTALVCALALAPLLAYAADPQFHFITENGNIFVISPPDQPRPANIIAETAHLAVHNPPAGMFVATAPNHTTHRITPLQAGLDISGFTGGTIRVILGLDWDAASDRTFRDQAFGTVTGNPMRHASTMPLAAGWNGSYAHVPLHDSSAFGMRATGANNTLPGTIDASNGGYKVSMGARERAGLDFGPGTGAGHTYYIYRGCSSCDAKVAVGHGDPTDPQETLPNDRSITDHDRGWRDTSSCSVSESDTWTGGGGNTVSATYTIPPAEYSNAGDHYIDSRYADLSILPQSHSSCSGTPYSEDNDDNSKHDMCVTGTSATTGSTTYRFSCTRTVQVETVLNGSVIGTTTSTSACSTTRTVTGGGCGPVTDSSTSGGYSVSATCYHGTRPATPSDSRTQVGTGNLTSGRITTTDTTHSGSYTVSTTATVGAACTMNTNIPYLDLYDAMSLKPGLNIYRPGTIPATHHILAIYDDTENAGGTAEYIQVYRSSSMEPEPAGPYSFHLRPQVSGILYDSHTHYGWVDARLYNSDGLHDMGYTQLAALAGHGDGLGAGGAHPYTNGHRLCHGDCFMGVEGIGTIKPVIREVAAAATLPISSSVGEDVYDHYNDRWTESIYGTSSAVTAATLYLVVPFAEDVSLSHVRMFDHRFDPAAQYPSLRNGGAGADVCHLRQGGQIHTFASAMNVTNGESLHIPVLPGMRYAAFIGNGDCYWYDIASLPSPLSSVSAGARHVPLVDGTILTGSLTARHDGVAHVDVMTNINAVWQSEMHGLSAPGTGGNATWVVPPLQANITAVARVNGAHGPCSYSGVYCSDPIRLSSTAHRPGAYIHGASFTHGEPYKRAPTPLPSGGSTGNGVYGLADGRCYGLATVEANTGGITVRSIPNIRVSAGDTISLSFEAAVAGPAVGGGNVTAALPSPSICMVAEAGERAMLDITMLTATLR